MNLLKKEILDKQFVENLIPQKYPFVMVDKLLFFSQEKVISGYTIPPTNIFLQDSVFTAPGLIEHMAQSVALHTGYQFYLKDEPAPMGYIGAIKKVEIKALPKIGQELKTTVSILYEIMGVTLVRAQVTCDNSLLAIGEMKTILVN